MSIPVQTPENEHTGNGVTTVFAYEFTILQGVDLEVRINGVIQSGGYTVSGIGDRDGGSIAFTAAPASGALILLRRVVALKRDTDYQENGDLLAETLDNDFDRIWMAIQDQGLVDTRTLRAPVGETLSELPAEVARDGYLAFSAGQPVVLDAPSASDASALILSLTSSTDPTKGAGMVGHNATLNYAAGTIGAVLNDVCINVKMFPWLAKGDGVTDDAAAIQAAINSLDARGGTILFPKGTYMVGTGLTLKTRAELRGSDRNNCTIRALPSATGITVLGLTGSAYNCRIRHLSIEGNDAAAKGIAILGATNGSNAHHLIEDVNASGCTVNAIHLKFIIYSRLQSVYASGGATTVLLEDMLAGSQEQCVYYNGSVQTVHMIRCSDIKAHACVYYNDVAFPATQIMLMDACWGCTNVLGTFEPQGAGCVTNTVTINDTDAGNCSDNTFLLCRFIGLTTTKTHDIAVGNSGSAFKTKIKDCQFIKPTATESIKLVNQANTEINGCVDLVTYDTPVYVEASVLNVSGNPYYKSSRIEGTGAGISNYLEGSWTPAAVCSTSGTIALTSPTDSMSYTRMGKRIFVSGRITVSSVSSPVGDLSITGLPFMATNSTGGNSALAVHASSLLNTSAHTAVQAQVVQNTSAIVIRGYNGGAQVNTMSDNIQAGSVLVISGSYLIA